LTLVGDRILEVEAASADGAPSAFPQSPGMVYIGNMTALRHNVVHEDAGEEGHKVAIMFRSNYFRDTHARRKNATPGPTELFHIVSDVIAEHLATCPFVLPDLAAVAAEVLDP